MPIYRGGCHCGALRFEVEGELEDLAICNCSICAMTAYIHWEVEPVRFRRLTPGAPVETYEFGSRAAKHHFCPTCGISCFRRSRSDPSMINVNVRCLEGVDVEKLATRPFDGKNWEQAEAREIGHS